jgi:cobalt-zinc-cadmium efflux system membrane fusion protein
MTKTRLAVALGVALMAACGGRSPSPDPAASGAVAPAATGPKSGTATAATYFTVPQEQMSHVQLATVSEAKWMTMITTTGTVDWDGDKTTQAITQVTGPITRLAVDLGSRVTVGQPLLYVASPDISNAVSAYRKAKNRLDLAQRNLDRARDLLEHKAIAPRDLESTQADYNDAATDVQTALQQLNILGVSQNDIRDAEAQTVPIRSELPMRSPIAGVVVQRLVMPGQVIQAGATVAFVISDVSTVWVQGHIYEKDLRSVRVGDTAEIRSASFPETLQGTVAYVGDLLDADTRTTAVRIVTRNPRAELKKDLFVDVTIHDTSSRQALVVPTASILYDEENFPFVYLQMQPGQFAQHAVQIGSQRGDQVEIVDGLKRGDRIVSQGSLFLQFANSYRG